MSTAPAKKRVRSEAQLVQKRAVDRVKHKQNRQEEKRRVERIETDIAQIKQALQDIATQLCVQPPASAVQTTTQGGTDDQMLVAADDLRAWQLTSLGSQSTGGLFTLPEELQRQVSGLGAPSLPQSVPEARSWVHPVQLPVPRIVNCRCGLRHSDQFNSLDNCNITTLYQGHIATAQDLNLGISLPRNPSLAAMMLHSQDENPAVNFITPFLRDCKGGKNVETLLGSYFIGYRLMRWYMKPDPSTQQDVPAWLLPTVAQNTLPHPVVVDYLPWPKLRDYLCLSGDPDTRHSFDFYFESTRLKLPPNCLVFTKDDWGRVSVSPEFEAAASHLSNWVIGPPWSEAFPHLVRLTQV